MKGIQAEKEKNKLAFPNPLVKVCDSYAQYFLR